MLRSKFVKFLMSVLKWQVIPHQILHYSSLLYITANFKVIPFLLWTKWSHQSPNFDTFKCSGENLPNFSSLFSNHKSVSLQNLHISSVLKRSLLKWKFLRLSIAQVKICQILYVNLEMTSRSLSKLCISLQFHER